MLYLKYKRYYNFKYQTVVYLDDLIKLIIDFYEEKINNYAIM